MNNFNDYSERTKGFVSATDVMTGVDPDIRNNLKIPAGKMIILELKKPADKK